MFNLDLNYKTVFAIGGVVLLFAILAERKAKAAVAAVGTAINPVSDQNLAYQGASAVTSAITGSQLPLGSQIYDWLNPTPPQ